MSLLTAKHAMAIGISSSYIGVVIYCESEIYTMLVTVFIFFLNKHVRILHSHTVFLTYIALFSRLGFVLPMISLLPTLKLCTYCPVAHQRSKMFRFVSFSDRRKTTASGARSRRLATGTCGTTCPSPSTSRQGPSSSPRRRRRTTRISSRCPSSLPSPTATRR